MAIKCPGSYRTLRIITMICPFCKTELEFFSDEGHRSCHECRKIVFINSSTACHSRCDMTEECLEINRWIEDGNICFRKAN
jgi:uncharacterized protein YbaR (Trm112 family)